MAESEDVPCDKCSRPVSWWQGIWVGEGEGRKRYCTACAGPHIDQEAREMGRQKQQDAAKAMLLGVDATPDKEREINQRTVSQAVEDSL